MRLSAWRSSSQKNCSNDSRKLKICSAEAETVLFPRELTMIEPVLYFISYLSVPELPPSFSMSHFYPIWLYLLYCICGIAASWEIWAQTPQITGTDTQKVIHNVKLLISYQMKPYSSLKAIWGSIYTCSSCVFAKLGQVGEIWCKYLKSWAEIHRKSSKVLNSILHIKWSLTQE